MKTYIYSFLFLFAHVVSFAQNNWEAVGPIQFPVDVSGQINGIGRVTQLKFHPTNPQTMYATSASGGLWMSVNNGATWQNLGTDMFPETSCASVCIDYTNDQVIYLGTGDPNYYGQTMGIWKTTDGGTTWNPASMNIGNLMAVEMLMSPTSANTIVAATNAGIWKTTDGAVSWVEKLAGGSFTDMKVHPTNPNIMYACTFDKYYRSANGGDTWTEITIGGAGVLLGDGCRLGVSAASPNLVYLAAVRDEGTVFKSTDSGLTFTVVYHSPSQSLTGYDAAGGGQGNYNFSFAADPTDGNTVYTSSHCVWKSTDGGVSWTKLTNWWAVLHTDMHQLAFSPANNDLININDGGVWRSSDGGTNWLPISDGLEATECYKAACSPVHPHLISIGTQDNGELFDLNHDWKTNRGGDWGSRMWYDYVGEGRVYYADGDRRNPSGSGESINLPATTTADGDVRFAFTHLNQDIGIATYKDVHLSTNLSQSGNNVVWTTLYSDTTDQIRDSHFTLDDSSVLYLVTRYDKILRCDNIFAASPVFVSLPAPGVTTTRSVIIPLTNNSNTVFVTCGNKVYRSTDRGVTWVDYSGTLPSVNILEIVPDRFSTNEALYLATPIGVYYRDSTLTDWVGYSQGLPTIAGITDLMMYHEGNAASKLRVSYYGRGVWESDLYNTQNALPYAQFSYNQDLLCPGNTVQFTDLSQGNPIAWSWTFNGGSPVTSTAQNPLITYNAPGTYNVTLTTTNTNGSDTETKNFVITVLSQPQLLPLLEDFEAGNTLPLYWTENNVSNDNLRWNVTGSASGFAVGQRSILIDNYNIDGQGARDEIRTPPLNFQNHTDMKLTFDVAYTTFPGYKDSLVVVVSTDCGVTFQRLYAKGGSGLATAPEAQGFFVPTDEQWRTDTVDLSAYDGMNNVMISFQNVAGYANVLYLDNINVQGVFNNAIVPTISASQVGVSPVPNKGSFMVNTAQLPQGYYTLRVIDIQGKIIYEKAFTEREVLHSIHLSPLAPGNYNVWIQRAQESIMIPFIVE